MQPRARVELVDPSQDRLKAVPLVGIAVFALVVGFAVGGAGAKRDTGKGYAVAAPIASAPVVAQAPVKDEPPPVPILGEPPPARPATLSASPRRAKLQRGLVVYLRCDGLAQDAGPFPCPRDLPFERSVWRALRELERCDSVGPARGAAEVRLGFDGETPHVLVTQGKDLTPRVVTECAGEALSSVRSVLRPQRMLVAFRFVLH